MIGAPHWPATTGLVLVLALAAVWLLGAAVAAADPSAAPLASPAPLLADAEGRYPVPMPGRFKFEYHD